MIEEKNKMVRFSPPKEKERLLSYIIKYRKQFLITAVSGIFFNSAIVLGPIFQGKLLDAAVNSPSITNILNAGISFILVTLSFQIARFFKRYYVRDMANRISGDMRISVMESILHTDLNAIEKKKVGDMMSTTIGDVDIVVEAVRKTITELWDTGVLMIAYFAALMFYDVKITLIVCIPIPFVIMLTQFMRKVVQAKSKAARAANSKTTTQIRKMISQINILRLYGREDTELKRFKERLTVQAKKTAIVNVLQNGLAPIYSSISSLGIILVIYLGGNKVIGGSWTIGIFTAYITMFTALAVRTTTAAKVFNLQQGAKASWDRVKSLLNNDSFREHQHSEGMNPIEISVNNLSFKYGDDQNYAIKNVSFKVPAGMIVGVTGSVGSGKSALGLALTGLYDYEGEICFNGQDLKNIDYNKKIDDITYMGHDSFLFSDSIKNNITWGNTDEAKLDKVLDIACLKQDMLNFQDGLETQLGEKGTRVSGGQRQRISMARALYKDSSIVILDDPFSAVDINTEAKIIKELRQNLQGRTIFIFSHRLQIFKYTDMILVFDKGRIAEKGTHNELINEEGIYSKILDSQSFLGGELYEA
ncbi:ABC transporter ATP-binding protein [Clostridium sp. JN-9]|uniref:ABC transporter ATP-binding protein n=1 Tax=Clostridium sp. JN-9 TaxID=2507159 RepID=UPI000FFE0B28|nr:ABC transporter ATP-binding protein [Clostridium sp. JN-9]QAT39662.1 ABC transporter ATP-binding protein [Clostridium sp. JN-9]